MIKGTGKEKLIAILEEFSFTETQMALLLEGVQKSTEEEVNQFTENLEACLLEMPEEIKEIDRLSEEYEKEEEAFEAISKEVERFTAIWVQVRDKHEPRKQQNQAFDFCESFQDDPYSNIGEILENLNVPLRKLGRKTSQQGARIIISPEKMSTFILCHQEVVTQPWYRKGDDEENFIQG